MRFIEKELLCENGVFENYGRVLDATNSNKRNITDWRYTKIFTTMILNGFEIET